MQIFDDIRQSFSELVFNTVLTWCPPVPVLLSCLPDKLPFCRRIERCCGFVSILTLTAHLEGRLGLDAGRTGAVCSTRKHSLENSLMRASNRLNRLQWVWLETRDTLIDGYKSRSPFHRMNRAAENRILGSH